MKLAINNLLYKITKEFNAYNFLLEYTVCYVKIILRYIILHAVRWRNDYVLAYKQLNIFKIII